MIRVKSRILTCTTRIYPMSTVTRGSEEDFRSIAILTVLILIVVIDHLDPGHGHHQRHGL